MKKSVKKLLCCMMTVFLIFSANLVVSAAAPELDSSGPNFQIESKSAKKGDELEVSVSVANNPGFWSVMLSITYDDGLSFVKNDGLPSVTTSDAFAQKGQTDISYSCSKLTYLYSANDFSDITDNGELFTVKIKVDDDAITGDYYVSFVDYSSSNFIDSEGNKVGFTFGNGTISVDGKNISESGGTSSLDYDYSFNAIDCSPVGSVSSTVGTHYQSDISPVMTLSKFNPTESGQYVEYTLPELPAGNYDLYTYSRDYSSSRGTFDIYIDDVLTNTIDFTNTSLSMNIRSVGEFVLNEAKTVKVKFVVTDTVNLLYLGGFKLYKDRPVYIDETVDIYTMNDGSKPSVFGVTRDYPNTSEIKTVSENNVLSFARTTDGISLVNRAIFFKLPDNIYTNYENLVSLSFTVKTDYGYFYSQNSGYNRIYMSSYPTESPTSLNAIKIANSSQYKFSTTDTVMTIDFTSDTGKYIINNDLKYINIINSVEQNNGNSFNYLYIDDVKLTYKVELEGNNVSIDGVPKAIIPDGKTFTLPNDDDKIVAYKDSDNNYYACGQSVIVNGDIEFTSLTLNMKTLSGASMRLNDSEVSSSITGIRYYTEIDTELVTELRDAGFDIQLGTLITPETLFGDKELTDLKHGVDFGRPTNYIDVKYGSNIFYTDDDFKGIVGSIIKISDNHAVWNYVARGYAIVSYNGYEKSIYADGDPELPRRSIGYIAYMIKNDTDFYDSLDSNKQSLVNYYYDLYCQFILTSDPYVKDKFD